MTTPSNEAIIEAYQQTRSTVKLVRKACEQGLAALDPKEQKAVVGVLKNGGTAQLEVYQANREAHLLKQDDSALFEFLTDLYINGRDGKASAEAKKKDIGLKQKEIESWLLKMLDKMKSTGFKTACGTVYPTRTESVGVEDWDAFLSAEILGPMASEETITQIMECVAAGATPQEVADILRSAAHFEFLNKAVNKTAVLEKMGEKDPKTDARPEPPPPGVRYSAIKSVGVRAK